MLMGQKHIGVSVMGIIADVVLLLEKENRGGRVQDTHIDFKDERWFSQQRGMKP